MKSAKRWKYLTVGCTVLLLVMAVLWLMEPATEQSIAADQPPTRLSVSTGIYRPTTQNVWVNANGYTRAVWATPITASVSGKVLALGKNSAPGNQVNQDTLLLRIDPTHLDSALQQAASRISNAKLQLAEMQHRQTMAKWDRKQLTSAERATPYARYEPQVNAAKAELSAARAAYQSAKTHHNDSRVVAPFDAVITQRHVSPGQHVREGDLLFNLISRKTIEVVVPIADSQWANLPQPITHQSVHVTSPQQVRWTAQVRYINPERNPTTHQRELVLTVASPYQSEHALLPGEKVHVSIAGKTYDRIYTVPPSAMTDDQYIWRVDGDNQLVKTAPRILYQNADIVWIQFQDGTTGAQQIVHYPLGTMLPGQQVQVVPASPTEATEAKENHL